MTSNRKLRNYKVNIKPELLINEYIVVGNDKLKKIINSTRSTATINTYLYLCLNVNKSKDKGYIRNTRCERISYSLGVPLSTIQDSIKTLIKQKFITRSFNSDRTSDYEIIGYKDILRKPYTKIQADKIFNDKFLQSRKDEVAAILLAHSSIYANSVAQMKKLQSISFLKDKQNYELIGQVDNKRVFSKKNLLSKIKRVCKRDLDRVLDKMKDIGLSVNNMFKEGISKTTNYLIGIDKDVLSSLFRPYVGKSHIENNPLAFDRVDKILCNTGLYKYFKKEDHEDLTQMYVEYGDLFFNAGVVALQSVVYKNYALVDEDGEKINNLCAYFRTSIDSFIEQIKSKV